MASVSNHRRIIVLAHVKSWRKMPLAFPVLQKCDFLGVIALVSNLKLLWKDAIGTLSCRENMKMIGSKLSRRRRAITYVLQRSFRYNANVSQVSHNPYHACQPSGQPPHRAFAKPGSVAINRSSIGTISLLPNYSVNWCRVCGRAVPLGLPAWPDWEGTGRRKCGWHLLCRRCSYQLPSRWDSGPELCQASAGT